MSMGVRGWEKSGSELVADAAPIGAGLCAVEACALAVATPQAVQRHLFAALEDQRRAHEGHALAEPALADGADAVAACDEKGIHVA
jgi:hypothetical protein